MKTMLLALLAACGAAAAADAPEAVYAKMHAAALAQDLEAMRAYAAQAERETLVLPQVPKTYGVTGKAMRKDGNAVELRATGTADSVGLGYTQIFGVIGLVKEHGEWKVERLSWSTERPGEYPEGYALVSGPAPEPRQAGEPKQPRFPLPPTTPERSRIYNPKRPDSDRPEERVLGSERSAPCEIKPVMSDDDLRACGAHVP